MQESQIKSRLHSSTGRPGSHSPLWSTYDFPGRQPIYCPFVRKTLSPQGHLDFWPLTFSARSKHAIPGDISPTMNSCVCQTAPYCCWEEIFTSRSYNPSPRQLLLWLLPDRKPASVRNKNYNPEIWKPFRGMSQTHGFEPGNKPCTHIESSPPWLSFLSDNTLHHVEHRRNPTTCQGLKHGQDPSRLSTNLECSSPPSEEAQWRFQASACS